LPTNPFSGGIEAAVTDIGIIISPETGEEEQNQEQAIASEPTSPISSKQPDASPRSSAQPFLAMTPSLPGR